MEQLMYDDKLTAIKAFQSYLTDIIDKGYDNNYETLMFIVKHIKNLRDDLIEDNSTNDDNVYATYNLSDSPNYSQNNSPNHSPNHSRPNSPNHSPNNSPNIFFNKYPDNSDNEDNEETEDEDEKEAELRKQKELNKLNKFIDGTDLSNIYLYKKDNNYIKNMESFIKKSYLY